MADGFSGFEKRIISLDKDYTCWHRPRMPFPSDAPRLVIVSYVPNGAALRLVQIAIRSIQKFTNSPYELWVVDNNSPRSNVKWLIEQDDINLVLNRSTPSQPGSFANGLALEIVKQYIHPDTNYLMTLHQDVMVCKSGWLKSMVSKFNQEIRAVGVREDKSRVSTGVLHVLGYIVDFQLVKEHKLSFMPELPDLDVGDRVIFELTKLGYRYLAAPNTHVDKSLVEKLPSEYQEVPADRCMDDQGEVFFMHLGRGVVKSGKTADSGMRIWQDFARSKLGSFEDPLPQSQRLKRSLRSLGYSIRRYYVDDFHFKYIHVFDQKASILDIGGKKRNKRGSFDIGDFLSDVKYANLEKATEPDYYCDIHDLPVESNAFDGVILSEVLEHVEKPDRILAEAYRVLKPGGRALICTPFQYHIHADPFDYGRYTDYWFKTTLNGIGFKEVMIERQGAFFSTLASMIRLLGKEKDQDEMRQSRVIRAIRCKFYVWISLKLLEWDKKQYVRINKVLSSNTTGIGVVCVK